MPYHVTLPDGPYPSDYREAEDELHHAENTRQSVKLTVHERRSNTAGTGHKNVNEEQDEPPRTVHLDNCLLAEASHLLNAIVQLVLRVLFGHNY